MSGADRAQVLDAHHELHTATAVSLARFDVSSARVLDANRTHQQRKAARPAAPANDERSVWHVWQAVVGEIALGRIQRVECQLLAIQTSSSKKAERKKEASWNNDDELETVRSENCRAEVVSEEWWRGGEEPCARRVLVVSEAHLLVLRYAMVCARW